MFAKTELIPIYFAAAAISGLLGGLYASSRGRNAVGWGLASCVLLIPVLICLAALPRLCGSCRCRLRAGERDCDRCAATVEKPTGVLYRWAGVVVLMVALFAFALMVALGSIIDGQYWPILRGTMVVVAMAMFLAFWGMMLRWRQWKLAAKTDN